MGEDRQEVFDRCCQHTLHLTDSQGQPRGSWVGEPTKHGTRFSCRCCGKFYGYRPAKVRDPAPRSTCLE